MCHLIERARESECFAESFDIHSTFGNESEEDEIVERSDELIERLSETHSEAIEDDSMLFISTVDH